MRAQLAAFEQALVVYAPFPEAQRIVQKVRAVIAVVDRELADGAPWRHDRHELSAELDAAAAAVLAQVECEWERHGFKVGDYAHTAGPPGPRPDFLPGR